EFARPIPAPVVAVAAARSGNGVFISRAVLITPLAVAARAIDILSLAGPVAIARSLSAIGHSLVPPVAAILLGRGVGSGGFLRIVAAPSLSPSVIGHAVILIIPKRGALVIPVHDPSPFGERRAGCRGGDNPPAYQGDVSGAAKFPAMR